MYIDLKFNIFLVKTEVIKKFMELNGYITEKIKVNNKLFIFLCNEIREE